MTSAFQSDAFQDDAFQIDAADDTDTHDGGRRRRRKRQPVLFDVKVRSFEEENRRLEALRSVGVEQEQEVYEELEAIAPQEVKRLESGRIEVNWDRLERDVRTQISAYLAERERAFLEQDDEDVILAAIH
jgi:hypothetical protein